MDSHPQIDILQTPSLTCINPVYNCLKYCFKANDYLQTAGVKATFFVSWFDPSNYPDGIPVDFAGKSFETGTPTDQNQFQWTGAPPLTIAEIADNAFLMLSANFDFFEDWSLSRTSGGGLETIFGTAREEGFVSPFGFSFPVAIPPIFLAVNGVNAVYLSGYKVIVEIWNCDAAGVLIDLLSRSAYEPDPASQEFCIDISRNLSSYVSTTFPGMIPGSDAPILDANICKNICLRFGQIFDEGLTDCDATPQFFETTSPIKIINSAFQKPEEVDSINSGIPLMEDFCYSGTPTRFLTDYPTGLPVCPGACFWLWYHLDADLSGLVNPIVYPFYRFFYTDGTNTPNIQGTTPMSVGECWSVPAGECELSFLADPLKTIEAIETTILVVSDFLIVQLSETFRLEIDVSKCCCNEFYFLNEKGGFDTIEFNCETEIALSIESSEICGFENCEGDILKGGKAEADRSAFETFTIFSQFNEDYFDLNWFRQFLKSPIRYIRKEDKIYKIKLLNDQIPIYTFEEKIFVKLEYVLSFELNQQNI